MAAASSHADILRQIDKTDRQLAAMASDMHETVISTRKIIEHSHDALRQAEQLSKR